MQNVNNYMTGCCLQDDQSGLSNRFFPGSSCEDRPDLQQYCKVGSETEGNCQWTNWRSCKSSNTRGAVVVATNDVKPCVSRVTPANHSLQD